MNTIIEDFIAYKLRIDKGLHTAKLIGAEADQIERLEDIIGFSLPDIYREFLLKVGKSSNDLFFFRGDLEMDIDSIIDHNEDAINVGADYQPSSFVFGYCKSVEFEIGLQYSNSQDDPRIVEMDFDSIEKEICESFSKFLFQNSFLHMNIVFNKLLVVIDLEKKIEELIKYIEEDFNKQWFSDPLNYLALKKDKQVLVHNSLNIIKNKSIFSVYFNDYSDIKSIIQKSKKFEIQELKNNMNIDLNIKKNTCLVDISDCSS